ncbi:MAG TPA: 23S rRNA (pseudouridine(1915)-N(3))-methyltransferase RlmH [Pyrinomonadaceae bacterium]|mgnify:CR=1 FL=1|nr:23S rRNA (pseudouridine(1915)-N(3))-methyltransferase RlmH [Pyrinomonadaceae bacterium]
MKIRFLWVGKTKNKHYLALQDDYLQRLSHFAKCEIVEVKDGGGKDAEGQRILQNLNPNSSVCLLDVEGRHLSSHELSREVERWQNTGRKETTFVIGGADGVSAKVAEMATDRISLSFLTFTHEMARVILLEQLYRAHTIIKGFPYQK